jgi:flagellar hook-associated protein 3 FlgL
LQLASGQRINRPSDDPAGAATLARIQDRSSQADSFLRSMGDVQGQYQTADSTLNSVVLALQRAISLGVEGANGTLSDSNRAALAEEVSGIRDQLLSLANVSYQGRYVFSGTAQVQPFALDGSVASGVRYDGNTGTNAVSIGNGYQLQLNVPGSQVFSAPGEDVFGAVTNLMTSLENNSGVDIAVTGVRSAFDHVTSQRVFYGNALNQIQSQQTYLNSDKLQLAQQQDTVGATDVAATVSQIVNAENARQAALAAVGKLSQMSLFNYLS